MRELPRSRISRSPTGKRITLQPRDLLTLEALQRHGPLPSHYLHEFTRHIAGDEFGQRKRLKDLWNENCNPHQSFYLERPMRQFQTYFARSQHLVYDLADGAREALKQHGKQSQHAIPPSGGFTHALMTACITASIDLAARDAGYRYIDQEEILARAPKVTRQAKVPLALPVNISHTFRRHGTSYTHHSDRPTIPDQLFGIDYGGTASFFALEVDRATEPVERTNLNQNSYLRKILAYRAINRTEVFKTQFGIPNLIVLNVTVSYPHLQSVLNLVRKITLKADGSFGVSNFMVQCVPEFATYLRVPGLLTHIFANPWVRAGKGPFFINHR